MQKYLERIKDLFCRDLSQSIRTCLLELLWRFPLPNKKNREILSKSRSPKINLQNISLQAQPNRHDKIHTTNLRPSLSSCFGRTSHPSWPVVVHNVDLAVHPHRSTDRLCVTIRNTCFFSSNFIKCQRNVVFSAVCASH